MGTERLAHQSSPAPAAEGRRSASGEQAASVMLDGAPSALAPMPPAGDGRQILALQRSHGNAFVGRLLGGRPPTSGALVQRGLWDWVQDKLDMRPNEAEMDAYEDAVDDLKDFRGKTYEPEGAGAYSPSTGAGRFDVKYLPKDNKLLITVRCAFTFFGADSTSLDPPQPKDPNTPWAPKVVKTTIPWTPAEEAAWKGKFFAQASQTWTGKHTFWCQKDWWETLSATPEVHFVEAPGGNVATNQTAHFRVQVYKRASMAKAGLANTVGAGWMDRGKAEFWEDAVDPNSQAKGATVASHESGHMLGLGDEYTGGAAGPLVHDKLVKAEFGKDLVQGKGDPESIMANGAKVLPEHGVTFLEALKAVTAMPRWGNAQKPPRAVPDPNKAPGTSPGSNPNPSASAPSGPNGAAGAADPSSEGSAGGLGPGFSGSPPGLSPH